MKRCPECGSKYPDDASFCSSDGAALEAVAASRKPADLVGRTIGRYRVHELIGAGGFGAVYAVENLRLGRVEALKVFRPADPGAGGAANHGAYESWLRGDFERETQALVRLDRADCSYIARIYDGGVFSAEQLGGSSDLPFYTMEFVEGGSLWDLVRRGAHVELPRAVRLLRQVCEALRVAHELEVPGANGQMMRGIVHRDLKLENVMVTRAAGEERVKVVDFGVAKVVGDQPSDRTRSLGLVLTTGCAAPEQMMGEATPAVDLFALGVLSYELLTGHEPWMGRRLATSGRVSQQESIERIMRPDRLKVVRPDRFRGDIPPELKAAIFRLLRKNPQDRFPTARAVEETLATIGGVPGAAVGGTTAVEVHTWVRGATPSRGNSRTGLKVAVYRGRKAVAEGASPLVVKDLPPGSYRIVAPSTFLNQRASRVVEVAPGEKTGVELEIEPHWVGGLRKGLWKAAGILLLVLIIGISECAGV